MHVTQKWRVQLNNFLQVNGGTHRLQYVEVAGGPAHEPAWHCTVYSESTVLQHRIYLGLSSVDSVPYAKGRGSEKGDARERAARACLAILCFR